jgi:bifunctional DNase/RNase
MLQMNVTIVAGCECERHAWVHLRDGTGDRRARVMIDAAVGRAIVSELHGTPSPHAEAVDMLGTSLATLGANAERVELRCTDGALSGVLCLRNADGEACAAIDPCHALLAACRMKLPIEMDEADIAFSSGATPPAVFHQFLESLDLSRLDPAAEERPS